MAGGPSTSDFNKPTHGLKVRNINEMKLLPSNYNVMSFVINYFTLIYEAQLNRHH